VEERGRLKTVAGKAPTVRLFVPAEGQSSAFFRKVRLLSLQLSYQARDGAFSFGGPFPVCHSEHKVRCGADLARFGHA